MNNLNTNSKKIFHKIVYTCILSIFTMSIFAIPQASARKNLDMLFSNTTDPFFIDLERKFLENIKSLNIQEEDLWDLDMHDFDLDAPTHVGTGDDIWSAHSGSEHTHNHGKPETQEQVVEKKVTWYFRTYVSNLLKQAQKNSSLQDTLQNHSLEQEIDKLSKNLANTQQILQDLSSDIDEKDLYHKDKLLKLNLKRWQIQQKETHIKNLATLSEETLDDMYTYAQILKETKEDLEQNKKNYAQHLESIYMMQIDISNLEGDIDDLKILSKYDSLAATLAQNHVSETLQDSLTDLLDEIQSQESKIATTLVLLDGKKEEYNLQTQDLIAQNDIYKQQVIDFEAEIEEVKDDIQYLQSQITVSEEKSASLQELITKHTTSLQRKKNYSTFFDFPVKGDITRLTSFFIDQWYINLFGFAHYAIDIPRPQWSPATAPAPGYVYKVFEQETSALNWFIVLHEWWFASVFLHMLSIDVEEWDFVNTGQVIWTIWGMPGTKWAWFHTTWPHLHREVWKDATIVDPLPHTDLSRVRSSSVLQGKYSNKWKEDNTITVEEEHDHDQHIGEE